MSFETFVSLVIAGYAVYSVAKEHNESIEWDEEEEVIQEIEIIESPKVKTIKKNGRWIEVVSN